MIKEMEAEKAAASPKPETIAEAEAQLNQIFEDARKKADQYLKSLKTAEITKEQSIPFEPAGQSRIRRRQSLIPMERRRNAPMETSLRDEEQKGVMHG